jgi:hypothetical protein
VATDSFPENWITGNERSNVDNTTEIYFVYAITYF